MKKHIIAVLILMGVSINQIHVAQCIYFEARGEGPEGWKVVMATIYTRVMSTDYPDTVHDVIWQPSQFSWTQDDKSDVPKNKEVFRRILTWVQQQSPKELAKMGVTHYHSASIRPYWANHLAFLGKVGNHLLYRDT